MAKIYDSNPNPPPYASLEEQSVTPSPYAHSDTPFVGDSVGVDSVKPSILKKIGKVSLVLQKIQPFLLVFIVLLLLFLVQLIAETRTNVKKILDDEVITVKDQAGNTVVVPLKYKGVLRTSEPQD